MAAPSPRHLERATGSELADDSGTRYRSLAPRRDRSGPVETKARGWTAGVRPRPAVPVRPLAPGSGPNAPSRPGGSPSDDGAPVDRGTLEVTRWLERFE